MINKNIEYNLAKKNNIQNHIKDQDIIAKIREKYARPDDEIAIIRKMLVAVVLKMKQLHPELDLTELLDYNAYVENCKNEINSKVEKL